MNFQFAVKHGRTVTRFNTFNAAAEYWASGVGGVLMYRRLASPTELTEHPPTASCWYRVWTETLLLLSVLLEV